MNHLYRSLWNDVTRTFVAVAEVARGRGKRSSDSRTAGTGDAAVAPPASLLRPLALEPRLMFDAAAVATAVEAVHAGAQAEADAGHAAALAEAAQHLAQVAPPAVAADRHEVAFIDTSVDGWQALRDGVAVGVEIVLLDGRQDGLAQMAQWAATHSGYDAIHVLSHGFEGGIFLGSRRVDTAALNASAAQLSAIGASLTAQGDILLYGCNVAQGSGQAFAERLAALTGADVAASNDATGAAGKGGDWVLEAAVGPVEAASLSTLAGYDGLLVAGSAFASGSTSDVTKELNVNVGLEKLSNGNTAVAYLSQVAGDYLSTDYANDPTAGNVLFDGIVKVLDGSNSVVRTINLRSDFGMAADHYVADASIESLANGGFVVAWADVDIAFASQTAKYAIYDNAGSLQSSGTLAASGRGVSIAAQANGDFAIAYQTNNAKQQAAVSVFDYGGSGFSFTPLTQTLVGDNGAAVAGADADTNRLFFSLTPPVLTALSDGSYVFTANTYDWVSSNYTPLGVFAFKFDAAGAVANFASGKSWQRVDWDNSQGAPASLQAFSGGYAVVAQKVVSGVTTWQVTVYDNDGSLRTATQQTAQVYNNGGTVARNYYAVDVATMDMGTHDQLTYVGNWKALSATMYDNGTDLVLVFPEGGGGLKTATISKTTGQLVGSVTGTGITVPAGGMLINPRFVADGGGYDITYSVLFDKDGGDGATAGYLVGDIYQIGLDASSNATPVMTNLGGDSVAWAGVGSTVVLDASGNATASDADLNALNGGNGDWSGASLTVQRSGTAVPADVLGFNTSGALFTVSGGDLQSGGLTFATYTSTGGVLTITFTSSGTAATTALVQDVMRHVNYRNDTPAGDATVRFTLSDGSASTTADVTVTSDIIYVTSTSDTSTIDASDGVGLREAMAIAAADATGSQTLILSSALASQTITLGSTLSVGESVTLNADAASGLIITGSSLSLGGGTTLSFTHGSGDAATINSTLSGTGGLAKSGAGTLTLGSTSNNSGWSGAMSVTGGTLTPGTGSNPASTLSSGSLTLDGGTLAMTITGAGTTSTFANSVVLGAGGGTINVTGGGGVNTADFTGVISGGSLTKSGASILQLSGNNTFTGSAGVTAGTLVVNHANALGTTAGATNVATGATLRVAGGLTVAESLVVGGSGASGAGALTVTSGSATLSGMIILTVDTTVNSSSGATLTLSGALAGGSQTLTKEGAGTLALSNTGNAAAMSGGMTVNAGTLSFSDAAHLFTGTLTLNGGTLLANTNAALTLANALVIGSGGATFQKVAGSALTLSGSLNGNGAVTTSGADITHTGSGTLTLDGTGITTGTSSALTLGSNVVLGSGGATFSASASINLQGVVSGSGNYTKSGSGWLVFAGSNTHSGTQTISAGQLAMSAGGTLGTGQIRLASGTTLRFVGVGTVTVANDIDFTSGGLLGITVDNAGTSVVTLTGALSESGGAASLTLNGGSAVGSQLIMAGTASYTGATNAGATVSINNASNLGTGLLRLQSGTFEITGTNVVLSQSVTQTSATTIKVLNSATLSGVFSSIYALSKSGAGTLTLTGTNTLTGAFAATEGTVELYGGASLGNNSTVTVSAGATLALNANETIGGLAGAGSVLLRANTLTTAGASSPTFSGSISGTGGLTKQGSGILTLSGINTYTGATTITAGGLGVSGGAALSDSSAVVMSGTASLVLSANETIGSLSGTGTVSLSANTLTVGGNGSSTTFSGVVSGSGGLSKAGSGSFTLTGNNTYTGATLVDAGSLVVNRVGGALADGSAVTISTGATLTLQQSEVVSSLEGAGTVSVGTNTLTTAGNTSTTFSGAIVGTGGLTKSGIGTLTLSGTNSYSGATTVNAGGLALAGGAALSDSTAVTLNAGTTLTLSASEALGSLAGSGSVSLGSNTLTAGGDNSSTSFAGDIGGTGGLTKSGSGTLTLTGNNSYAGATTVSGGTLTSDRSGGALADGSAVTVASGASLVVQQDEVIASLAGAGAATLNGYLLLAGAASTTYSGQLSGAGDLYADGGGTLTLAGSNSASYSGDMFVRFGSGLSIAGDANLGSGQVSLNDGTLTLTGTDTVDNLIDLTGTGSIQVGSGLALTLAGSVGGTGALSMTGAGTLTLGSGTYAGTTSVAAGTLQVTGTLDSGGAISVASGATLGGTGTLFTSGSKLVNILAGATLAPGVAGVNNGIGKLTVNGILQLAGTLSAELGGGGGVAGTDFDQVAVNGSVALQGGSLGVTVVNGYTLVRDDVYRLVDNDGSDAFSGPPGSFSGLAEGVRQAIGSDTYRPSYLGGTGNDFTLTVANNTPPVVGSLNGDSQAYMAGSTVRLDPGNDAVVSDMEDDAGNWNGGRLVVQRVTGGTDDATANDLFGLDLTGTGLTISGSTLQSGGQTFATFTSSGGVLSISFTGSGTAATTALVQDLVRRVTYRNDTPYGDATLRLALTDSLGATVNSDVTLTSSVIYVDVANDDADGDAADGFSLREALARGVAQAGADTLRVVLAGGSTITLGGGVTSGAGDTLNLDGASGLTITGSTLTLGGGLTVTGSGTLASTLAGSAALTKGGAGTLALTSTGNEAGFSGTTAVLGGSLSVSNDDALGAGALTLNGGTLTLTGNTTIDNAIAVGVNGATMQAGVDVTLAGTLSGGGQLAKTGAGTLTLTSTGNAGGSFTGNTLVSDGALSVASGANLGGTLTLNGGQLTVTAAGPFYNAIAIGVNGGVVDNSATVLLGGAITGTGLLQKQGGGTLLLDSMANAGGFSGGTTVRAGTLSVGSDSQLGAGTLTLNGGSLSITGSGNIDNAIALQADATVTVALGVGSTLSGAISGSGKLTLDGNGDGAVSLTNAGNAGSHTGTTEVRDVVLAVVGDANLGAGAITLNGGTLSVGLAGTVDNAIVVGVNGGTVEAGSALTLSGALGGSGVLSVIGSTGSLTLTNAGNAAGFSGDIAVRNSTLRVASDDNLGAGALSLNGGTLTLTAATTVDNALGLGSLGGTVVADANAALSGVISGGGSLTKTGGAVLTLAGTSTYAGSTTVQAGALQVTGALTGTSGLTVASGATLAGTGSVGTTGSHGLVVVQAGGTLAPGLAAGSAGTLTLRNGLVLMSGGQLLADVRGSSAGSGYDQVVVEGSVNLNGGTLTLDLGSYLPTAGEVYRLIDNDGGDAVLNSFSGLAPGATRTVANGRALQASYAGGSGNDVTLTALNAAPTVANALAAQNATEDSAFGFTVLANTFADIDVGDTLTYTATLADGSALPAWLSFDAATRSFSGTPLNGDVGAITVKVVATDGSGNTGSGNFVLTVANTNDAPVSNGIAAQSAVEDAAFSFTVPANAFTDVDVGDTLTYTATLADGSALPSWLSFDAATRAFSGTPANGDVGAITVKVTLTDGSAASASGNFTLTVTNTNDAPTAAAIVAQGATEDSAFSFTVPANTFADVDVGDTLSYSATLADGSALPAWLSFNAATRTFSGTPLNGAVGAITVKVTATDGSAASASSNFTLTVANTNDAPTSTAIAAQAATEDGAFSFQVPANTFADVDVGDTLAYTATLADGSALPSWLSFNAATRTFSGTPLNGDVGAITVKVTATDGSSASASSSFTLTVANTNDAPTSSAIAAQAATEDAAFSFQVPADTFADVDAGDTLSYSATLADGSALPAWLSFNAATRTFSGTPANGDVGAITVKVTAADGSAASASSNFTLTAANTNDAPTSTAVAAQAATEDGAFSFQIPANTFADVDAGDTLTYTATLANGSALPAWLSFNAATRTFSGTPLNGDVGAITVKVTATDGGNASASSNFTLTVANTNDVPTSTAIAPQSTPDSSPFSFTVPAGTFTDVDAGDALRFSATLAGGGALPAWLSFDAATRTFSGTPAFANIGAITLRVVATDASGASVSSDFTLTVTLSPPQPLVPVPPVVPDTPAAPTPLAPVGVDARPVQAPVADFLTAAPSGVVLESVLQPPMATRPEASAQLAAPVPIAPVPAPAPIAPAPSATAAGLQVVPQLGTLSLGGSDQRSVDVPLSSFLLASPAGAVTVEARQADGRPLPAWLRYDAASGKLVGRAPTGLRGVVQVELIARDGQGQRASTRLEIRIDDAPPPAGDAPVPADRTPAQQVRPQSLNRAVDVPERLAARPGLSEQLRQARGLQRSALVDRLATAPRADHSGPARG